jgi:hypothetical protein
MEPIDNAKEGLEILKIEIYKKKIASCYGCVNDCPSLRDHDCYESDLDELYKTELLANLFLSNKISQRVFLELNENQNGRGYVKTKI